MGNDGGDIPGRKELVKEKKKDEIPDPQSVAVGRSRFCNLTKQKLKVPLAICRLGYIYNYECLLQALVEKILPKKYKYIRKLADIKKIEPQLVPAGTASENVIMCPISKLEYNGFNKFVALWSCGHVISVKALKEVQNGKKCLICEKPYQKEDVVDLNMTPEVQEKLKQEIIEKHEAKQKNKGGNTETVNKDKEELDLVRKLPKKEVHVNKLEKLDQLEGTQIKEVIRTRDNFKELFHKKVQTQSELFIRNTKIGIL